MNNRALAVIGVIVLALVLLSVTLALAQDATTPGPGSPAAVDEESRREAEAALAAQAAGASAPQFRAPSDLTATGVISGPLFIGVDDINVSTYLIDPETGDDFPQFSGFQVWGAAYDPDNNRVLFNYGIQLYEWPVNGTPALLGNITSAANAANLAMVGLAFHDGVLYGTTNVSSAANPEAVYAIDTTTMVATLHIEYNVAANNVDMGGLAVDPDTGTLYATNDSSTLRGLVIIAPDGGVTVVAPYPAGQTDIDGLSIGDGRAYLVTDQPGDIYVYDLVADEYLDPIPNPWTTAELFAGATWLEIPPPSIVITKTAGLDVNVCAVENQLEVGPGTEVTYCYTVENTGVTSLTRHTLEDSELGGILDDFPFTLNPGATAFLTETATITETTTNTATWTAYNPGPTDVVTATAEATVTVVPPSIVLTKTVGLDPNSCATDSEIAVDPGTEVTYCYEVENTGLTTLTRHTLEDSELGNIISDFTYSLVPGATAFFTQTATIEDTTTNTATWTAYNPGPTDEATATAEATVTMAGPHIEVEPQALEVQLEPDTQTTRPLTINNVGSEDLAWALTFAPQDCAVPGVLLWATFTPPVGTTDPGDSDVVTVTFDAAGVAAGTTLEGVLCVTSNDAEQPTVAVPLSLSVVGEVPIEETIYMPVIVDSP